MHSYEPSLDPRDPLLALAISALQGRGRLTMPRLLVNGDNKALCEQAMGLWRCSVPWVLRSTDVPSILLSLHAHFGFPWFPHIGGYLQWRPRRFNTHADQLARTALADGRTFSRWSSIAFELFLRSLLERHPPSHPARLYPPSLRCSFDGSFQTGRGGAHASIIFFSVAGVSYRLYEEAGFDDSLADAYCAEERGLVRLLHAIVYLAHLVSRGRDSIIAR